jgi:hypothetical protein
MSDDPWTGGPFSLHDRDWSWMEEPEWWDRGPWKEIPWVDFLNQQYAEFLKTWPNPEQQRRLDLMEKLGRTFAEQQTAFALEVLTGDGGPR